MAVPTRRLDLVLVPADPEGRPEAEARELWRELVEQGIVEEDGTAGAHARRWCAAGFARLHVDLPKELTLWANQVGGFKVRCPSCGQNLVLAFNRALTDLRAGGPRTVTCDRCGETHPLEALDYRPPAALGRLALVTADVGEARLTEEAMRRVEAHLGPVRTVLRRV